MIQENQKEVSKTIEQYNSALKELNGGNYRDFEEVTDGFAEKENRGLGIVVSKNWQHDKQKNVKAKVFNLFQIYRKWR